MTVSKPKPLKCILVGCGNISRIWVSAILKIPNLGLIGFVDKVLEKTHQLAQEFGLKVETDSNLQQLLDRLRPDIVFDCTTPENRLSNVSTAFAFGCDILVEKPLADNMLDASKIVFLAKKTSNICSVIQNHRYNAGIRNLAQIVQSGKLGKITQCSSNFFIGVNFKDFRQNMAHVLLKDMAIHTFDAARFILADEPISVYCQEWNPIGSNFERDGAAVAIFQFKNNLVYTYQGSWCAQGLRSPWESQWRINGTNGSILWDGKDFKGQIQSASKGGLIPFEDISISISDSLLEGHAGVIDDFIISIRNNRLPPTACGDNIKSLTMVFAAIESSRYNKKVEINM